MKKLMILILSLLLLLGLTGCCLKHDYLPATCTEPSTCSKCGQTQGTPLEHHPVAVEAVEPSCTEPGLTEGSICEVCGTILTEQQEIPASGHQEILDEAIAATCVESGLTEGSHCEVCGEILAAQEIVPATGHTEIHEPGIEPACTSDGISEGVRCEVCGEVLSGFEVLEMTGHDWKQATFSMPKTCRICGETEGKGKESAFFTDAVDSFCAQLIEAQDLPAADFYNDNLEFSLSGNSVGSYDLDDILNGSSIRAVRYHTEDGVCVSIEVTPSGMKPLTVLLQVKDGEIQACIPELDDHVYVVGEELLATLGDLDLASLTDPSHVTVNLDTTAELLSKYAKILFKAVTVFNTTEKQMVYDLPVLNDAVECHVLTIQPSRNDWRAMLRELFVTLRNDPAIEELIRSEMTKADLSELLGTYMTSEQMANMIISEFHDYCDECLDDAEYIADELSKVSLTIAFDEHQLYDLRLTHHYFEESVGFAISGPQENGRKAVVYYEDEILLSMDVREDEEEWYGEIRDDDLGLQVNYRFRKDMISEIGIPYGTVRVDGDDVFANISIEADPNGGSLHNIVIDDGYTFLQLNLSTKERTDALVFPDGPEISVNSHDELFTCIDRIVKMVGYSYGLDEPGRWDYKVEGDEIVMTKITPKEIVRPDFERIHSWVYNAPMDATYDSTTGVLSGDRTGIDFDVEAAGALWDAADNFSEVRIPLIITEPKVTSDALYRDRLGGYAVVIEDLSEEQVERISTAAADVDGMILQPGKTFSLLIAAGYPKQDYAVEEPKPDTDGLQYIASPLYAAAQYADLVIVERTPEMYPSDVIPMGLEAAFDAEHDLVLSNTGKYPVKFQISYVPEDSMILCTIYGTQSEDLACELKNEVTDVFDERFDTLIGWTVDTYRDYCDMEGNVIDHVLETSHTYAKHHEEIQWPDAYYELRKAVSEEGHLDITCDEFLDLFALTVNDPAVMDFIALPEMGNGIHFTPVRNSCYIGTDAWDNTCFEIYFKNDEEMVMGPKKFDSVNILFRDQNELGELGEEYFLNYVLCVMDLTMGQSTDITETCEALDELLDQTVKTDSSTLNGNIHSGELDYELLVMFSEEISYYFFMCNDRT